MAVHWSESNHQISQLRFTVLEAVKSRPDMDPYKQLLQAEVHWIKKLQSMQPVGLNDRIELSCFL